MNIIGLDCSTRTGAVVLSEVPNFFFSTELENKKLKGLDRVVWFGQSVGKLLDTYTPSLAVIEDYGFANSHTLVPLVEIGTVIRLACYTREIPLVLIPPTSVKKFLTKGAMSKDMVMLEVYKRWGFDSATNNIADAYVLSRIGKAIQGFDVISKDSALSLKKITSVTSYMEKSVLDFTCK